MQLFIRHETTYRYETVLHRATQNIRLTPRQEAGQRIAHWSVTVPGRCTYQLDAHGNRVHLATIPGPLTELTVSADGMVETDSRLSSRIPMRGPLAPMVYLTPTELTLPDDRIREIAGLILGKPGRVEDRLARLSEEIAARIRYRQGVTEVHEDAATVLSRGEGVCQDQAHAFLACCRAGGIPARYVSGYFNAGATGNAASHAWADAWLGDDAGWVSFDVTHQCLADQRHCRLAVGRDYKDAAPLRGVRQGGGSEILRVIVVVAESAVDASRQYDEQRTRYLAQERIQPADRPEHTRSSAASQQRAMQAQADAQAQQQ
jgi:transglutaminase-like putative cysteine protease